MISLRNMPLKVEFIPLSTLNYIDPNDHLVGYTLLFEEVESPRKSFLSLFESFTQSPKREIKRPLFQTTPKTERNYSLST